MNSLAFQFPPLPSTPTPPPPTTFTQVKTCNLHLNIPTSTPSHPAPPGPDCGVAWTVQELARSGFTVSGVRIPTKCSAPIFKCVNIGTVTLFLRGFRLLFSLSFFTVSHSSVGAFHGGFPVHTIRLQRTETEAASYDLLTLK